MRETIGTLDLDGCTVTFGAVGGSVRRYVVQCDELSDNDIIYDVHYFVHGRDVKYCDDRVCLSVCTFARASKIARPNFTKFSVRVNCSRGSVLI